VVRVELHVEVEQLILVRRMKAVLLEDGGDEAPDLAVVPR